jgi:hypothetical protein
MAAAFNAQDLILLGYDSIQEIDAGSSVIAYKGKAKAGIVETEHAFVYVKSDATRDELIQAAKSLSRQDHLYVLKSRSGPADSMLKAVFGNASAYYLIEELLWTRVLELFKSYAENISIGIPSEANYVAPRGEDLQPKDRLDDYLIDYFTKDVGGGSKKRLVVLKASAGVGKTTLCRQLVRRFAQKVGAFKVIPVYIEAAYWGGRVTRTSGLWDIIQLSLQNYGSGTEISKTLFEAALKRGLILFILDGFDELCSGPRSNISALEVMESLRDWVQDGEARIVLTTRTPYWNLEIGKDPEYAYSLNLLSFNPQQARQYIRKFFESDEKKFAAACDLYADVIKHANMPGTAGGARANFWTLPIAVSMVCDAVRAGVTRDEWRTYSLEKLLEALCERESKRQQLSISGSKQLAVFQELALLDPTTETALFEKEDLQAAGVFDSDVAKFSSHPLLRARDDGRYSFAYDFIAPFLRALVIRGLVNEGASVRPSVLAALKAEENGKGFQIEHASRLLADGDIEGVYSTFEKIPITEKGARSFMAHLLLRLADQQSSVVTAEDRALVLLRAISDGVMSRTVRNFRFTGHFERLDLSKIEFVGCEFVDFSVKDVDFSGSTFKACLFDGEVLFATPQDAKNFSSTNIDGSCEMRGEARLSLESVLRKTGPGRDELIKDLLEVGLSKFWHNGKHRPTLRKADWKKGALGRAQSSEDLLQVLRQNGLISDVHISGVQEGGWLFNRDAVSDLRAFMDHRRLSGLILNAFTDLQRILRA